MAVKKKKDLEVQNLPFLQPTLAPQPTSNLNNPTPSANNRSTIERLNPSANIQDINFSGNNVSYSMNGKKVNQSREQYNQMLDAERRVLTAPTDEEKATLVSDRSMRLNAMLDNIRSMLLGEEAARQGVNMDLSKEALMQPQQAQPKSDLPVGNLTQNQIAATQGAETLPYSSGTISEAHAPVNPKTAKDFVNDILTTAGVVAGGAAAGALLKGVTTATASGANMALPSGIATATKTAGGIISSKLFIGALAYNVGKGQSWTGEELSDSQGALRLYMTSLDQSFKALGNGETDIEETMGSVEDVERGIAELENAINMAKISPQVILFGANRQEAAVLAAKRKLARIKQLLPSQFQQSQLLKVQGNYRQ